jgi:hypothetical protein
MHRGETELSNVPIDASLTRDTSKRDDGLRPPTKVNATTAVLKKPKKETKGRERGIEAAPSQAGNVRRERGKDVNGKESVSQ